MKKYFLVLACLFIFLVFGIVLAQSEKPKIESSPATSNSNEPVTSTSITSSSVISLGAEGIVYIKEKRIEIPAIIANPNMPLELLGCSEGGKDYESLVILKCKPQNVHMALILFGLKEGKGAKEFGESTKPTGDLVLVFIEWQDKNKKTVTYRAEDLIIDNRTNLPWPRTGWAFIGSSFEDEIDYDTGKSTGRKIYLANATKTIIATYHDPTAILDNPTESGGVGNIYFPNKEILPESGTPAKVIIRVPDEKELKEMKKVNEEVAKWEAEWKKMKEEEQKKKEKK